MKRFGMGTLLLVVFLVGCATAVVTQSFIVPPIRANTNPQKWEYKCIDWKKDTPFHLSSKLNKFGKEGWEIAMTHEVGDYSLKASYTAGVCFKRPRP